MKNLFKEIKYKNKMKNLCWKKETKKPYWKNKFYWILYATYMCGGITGEIALWARVKESDIGTIITIIMIAISLMMMIIISKKLKEEQ